MRARSRFARPLTAAAIYLLAAGCDNPPAIGEANNIVVAAPDSIWEPLEDELAAALEPTTYTVRRERIFELAQADPRSDEWSTLSKVRQVLVIGEPADPWVAEVLSEREGAHPSPPAIVQARNVWAQNQLVTVLLLPPGSSPEAARPLIAAVGDTLLNQFERYARARMYFTGVSPALMDSLQRTFGFSLRVPEVYRIREVAPGVVVFRNDNPDPSQLIREVDVASRPNGEVPFTVEAALEWRARLAERVTQPPQVTDPQLTEVRRLTIDGHRALELQGVWRNPAGEWPAGGPFIARMVECPERTYLLSAWLYAPGKAKFEYMVQLDTLLNSFRC